jgi:hypothetical protein
VADSRPLPTPEHRERLRQFVYLVDDMNRSRFVERCRTQDHSIACQGPQITAPEYDWEDFRSFLTTFRQVAISKSEPVYVFRIIGILRRYASPELQKQLAALRDELAPRLEGEYVGIRYGRELPSGEEVSFTSREALNALVNGQVFHADASHRWTLQFLPTIHRWQYLWPILFEIVIPALDGCVWLFHAMRRDGILDDSDYPERCRRPSP